MGTGDRLMKPLNPKLTLSDQSIDPRQHHGIDFGNDAKVLIVNHLDQLPGIDWPARLMWRGGSTYTNIGYSTYTSAALRIYTPDPIYDYWLQNEEVFSGGRLSMARLREHFDRIAEGIGYLRLRPEDIDLRKTLHITWT